MYRKMQTLVKIQIFLVYLKIWNKIGIRVFIFNYKILILNSEPNQKVIIHELELFDKDVQRLTNFKGNLFSNIVLMDFQ